MLLALTGTSALAAEQPQGPDYNDEVLPIFTRYCLGCHDSDGAEGNFVLDNYERLLDGGDSGVAVVPGQSDASRLVLVLEGKAEPAMPPEGSEGPTDDEIALLKHWIDAGAKGPSGATPDPTRLVIPRIEPTVEPRRAINALAYSPDGKLLAVAGYREVRLLDTASRGVVRTLGDHANNVTSVSFSSDGSRLIAAAGEPGLFGQVKVWSVADGSPVATLQGHKDSLYAAVLTPDGGTLATAGYDGDIILWDAASGEPLRTLSGHNGAVYALAFSPDGTLLASASADRTVKLWNVADGERLDTFGQSLEELYAVAFSPDGRRIAAGGVDNRIRVWQLSESRREGTNPLLYSRFAHQGAIIDLAYSPDGATLVSTAEDQTVKVWEAAEVKERLLLETQPDWAPALAIAPDNRTIAVGRLDGTLAFYDAADGSPVPPAAPELASLEPRGIERGRKSRLLLHGKNLLDVKALQFNHQGLSGTIVEDAASLAKRVTIDITAADEVPRGSYEVAVVTPGGTSGKLKFEVDDHPQRVEAEPNDRPADSTTAELPVSFWGTLSHRGDIDSFSFHATEGETVVLDVAAKRFGSKANAILTLFDEGGRVVASASSFDGDDDPLLAFEPPTSGRYMARVSDLMQNGSAEHFYRLSIGHFPYVTGVFPLSVAAHAESDVELAGYNLPDNRTVRVKAGDPGSLNVPIDTEAYRARRAAAKVVVGHLPEFVEAEPNDTPQEATLISPPCAAGGRIWSGPDREGPDADLFRFEATAGEQWVIETEAASLASPVDTKIEVLDAQGRPVERLLLQATRDSYIEFRSIDSNTVDVRVKNWEEMELNQYLYLGGEVCKLFRLPQGPDSGFNFYAWQGKRIGYFDTSATTHPVHEPCYIVEPHEPGTDLVPTGLPVFALHYANDDDGQRKRGRDSRLMFTAPADGEYLVRVTDVRDGDGDRFAYRLIVRHATPDFRVTVDGGNGQIPAGGGKNVNVVLERIDDFDGEVRIDFSELPPGFSLPSPVTVEAGHYGASTVVFAAADAEAPVEDFPPIKITATATIDGSPVVHEVGTLGPLKLAEPAKLAVSLEPAELVIAPGSSVTATLKLQRNGFDGAVSFNVNNLPHGVIVDNIGLNGVLIPEGQTERQIFLTARDWVPETSRYCHAVAGTGEASAPLLLHVRQADSVARAEE